MNNIERRRKQRKLIPIVIAAAAAAAVIGLILLLVFKPFSGSGEKNSDPTEPPLPTASVTDAAAPSGSDPEGVTATETTLPSPSPAAETQGADEPKGETPIRISDEESTAVLTANISKRYGTDGNAYLSIAAKEAIAFVNNTDRPLYSISLKVGDIGVDTVTLEGAPVRFSLEEGVLTIPLLNELPPFGEADVFIEYSARADASSVFALPEFDYETSYRLTAYVASEAFISFSGCSASSEEVSGKLLYSVTDESVHSTELRFRY
ncbi:MAG: hypothetical protein IKG85_04255 [Clostridia bacterium]|nr:hypothetical protein [Clostridia bacterium]